MSMDAEDPVLVNINSLLGSVPKPVDLRRHSIYRVPKNVRDNADLKHYEPQLISIGPYHRSKEHLLAMEKRKRLYLQRFLDESGRGTLEQCIERLRAREQEARACYFEGSALKSAEFVEMLLLDGCFIVQFFLHWFCGKPSDPMFYVAWNLPLLLTDLLMLENQIPYFVLLEIYDIHSHDPDRPRQARPKKSLTYIITKYFNSKERRNVTCVPLDQESDIDHLLHLYHSHFITPPNKRSLKCPSGADTTRLLLQGEDGEAEPAPAPRTVRCAKELRLHGVTFRCTPQTMTGNILNVTFDQGSGVFEIPGVEIHRATCSKYLNLVAFEQSRHGEEKYFTSYVVLLDNLVNTAEDVLILEKNHILVNMLPNEEDAAKFFNQLSSCSYIDYENHYLAEVYTDLHAFCRRRWPRYKAMFRRNYHNSPWSIFGFYLGSLFALITIFTTIITILEKFTHVLN